MKKISKFFMALMFGLLIVLGANDIEVKASSTWSAPVWEDYKLASVRWKLPSGAFDDCDGIAIDLYRDGNRVASMGYSNKEYYKQCESLYAEFNYRFDESGAYTVKVVAYIRNEDGSQKTVKESPESIVFDYTLPSAQLPAPINLKWVDGTEHFSQYDWAKDESFYATAYCDEVEGADEYEFTFYAADTEIYRCWGQNFLNFTDHIVDPAFDYTFTVRAISSDILTYRNSEFSEHSVKYTENIVEASGSPAEIPGLDCAWNVVGGKSYWYENGIKQGTYDDPNGVIGDGTVRGREIYDAVSNGWYWLDACYDGAKAVGKEVWMPYIYQNEKQWNEETMRSIAYESDEGMEECVLNAMISHTGKWVRYDNYGRMLKGWVSIEGELANLYPSQKGNTYYYDNRTGLMAKGWVTIDGVQYHFDEVSGVLDSGEKPKETSEPLLVRTESSNGQVTTYEYNSEGNLIRRNYLGVSSQYIYDDNGYLIRIENSDGSWTKYENDSSGNPLHAFSSGGWEYFYQYDSNNNVIYQKIIMSDGTVFGEGYTEYDENGRKIKQLNADLEVVYVYEYNSDGVEICKHNNGYSTSTKYDDYGNILFVISPSGLQQKYEYDIYGNQVYSYIKTDSEIEYTYTNTYSDGSVFTYNA